MSQVQIYSADKEKVRQLIYTAKCGSLTDREVDTLEEYLCFSAKLYLGSIRGRLCCAWGLIPPTLLSDTAYLWLFSTPAIDEHKFLFVRTSQRVIEEMLQEWPVINGFCDHRNLRSIRWLKLLGARFGDVGPTHVSFEIRKA